MDIRDEKEQLNTPGYDGHNKSSAKKEILIIVTAGLILLAGLWIWKSIEIRNLKKQAQAEKQELKIQAGRLIQQSHEMHLKLLAKPFVWAVRTEMLKNNISQVNLYTNEMVKEKNFQNISIINDKGMVILSTNKKEEGKEFSTTGNTVNLLADSTTVHNSNDSLLVLSSPIMGFNSRLGTLLISYSVQPQQFK